MADCYYHGYSGSPGPCDRCAEEDRHNAERGSIHEENFFTREVARGPEFHPDRTVRSPRKK